MSESATLGFDDDAHDQVRREGASLLERLAMASPHLSDPNRTAVSAALYVTVEETAEPPRWGYPVGAEIVRRARAGVTPWATVLAAGTDEIVEAAAVNSSDSWAAPLGLLAKLAREMQE